MGIIKLAGVRPIDLAARFHYCVAVSPATNDSTILSLLQGTPLRIEGTGVASDYASELLSALGAVVLRHNGSADENPGIAWARCGLMALTGNPAGEAQMCPVPLASCADGVLKALAAVAGVQTGARVNCLPPSGAALLGEHAAIAGLQRQGAISPGAACQLMPTGDGWIALNLARADDWALLPAWLETELEPSWPALADVIASRATEPLLERGHLMGLTLAAAGLPAAHPGDWLVVQCMGSPCIPRKYTPLVIDLSSLWAGPLCTHLLQALGARVIKVESLQRPDGARAGPSAFYDLLNAGKQSVALDFSSTSDLAQLRELISRADIVIEASRPRALRQLGIVAEDLVAARPGLTWVGISGYRRSGEEADWTAFGDDAGVAAGLSGLLLELCGEALICGDAIADPLAGMHAALAAWAGYSAGGGHLLSLGLRDVVAHCAGFSLPASRNELRERWLAWNALARDAGLAENRPQARPAAGIAQPLGADTVSVLAELGIAC